MASSETAKARGARAVRSPWVRAGLAIALAGKLALLGAWAQSALASGAGGGEKAAGTVTAAPAPAPRPAAAPVREVLEAVQQRQAELDARERELEARAERLRLIEEDVSAKLASLEEIEKRLAGEASERREAIAASAESLAKIYAAMKPADAAPILDRLDDETILTIFARMKEKQIGEILPLMSRERAIVLTQAIATRR